MQLFRRESQEARASAWLGRILLIRPVSFTFLTAAALGMAAALGAFLVFGEYTRKAHLSGVLAPADGVVRVISQQTARVGAVAVREGAVVGKDDVLMSLEDSRTIAGHEALGAAVASQFDARRHALRRQREFASTAMRAEQDALSRRRADLGREVDQIDAEIEALGRRVRLAQHSVDRASRLESIGFLSAAALDREKDAAMDHEGRVEAMRRARMGLMRELAASELESAASLSRANAQLAALDTQQAAIDLERFEREVQLRTTIV